MPTVGGMMTSACGWSLARAMTFFALMPYDGEKKIGLEVCDSSNLAEGRTRLVSRAFSCDATHVLWVDSDMKFPEDVIPKLLNHNKLVVGANYPTKEVESRPTAYRDDDDYIGPVWTKKDSSGLEPVSHVGLGLTLIDMRVYDALELPYFHFQPIEPDFVKTMGEDVYFFRKMKAAGIECFIDHDLSQNIAHVGKWEYTNQHAVQCQETKLQLYDELPGGVDHGPVKIKADDAA